MRHAAPALQRVSEAWFDYPIHGAVRATPVLLIRIPKNASMSASHSIYGRDVNIPHRTALFYKESDPEFFSRVTKIAVVRDPWDRAVSAYEFLRSNGTPLARPSRRTGRCVQRLESFERYLDTYLGPDPDSFNSLDPVSHPQAAYVCDEWGGMLVDRVFRFEALDELAEFLKQTLDPSADIAHVNRTPAREGSDYRRYYTTSAMIEKVAKFYARDLALFGYRWD